VLPSRRLRRPLLLLTLVLLLAGCREKTSAASPVLIRVEGRTVTLEQFRQSFDKSLPPEQALSDQEKADLQRAYLVQMVDRELALAEADRLGIGVTPAEVEAALQEHRRDYPAGAFEEMLKERRISLEEWRRELAEGLLMEKVFRRAVYSGITVDEKAVAAYYEAHRDEFDRPAQVRARQIVVSTPEEGERILAQLAQGAPFDELAREHSLSPDREQGGDLGYFARGEMPAEFDAVVFTLAVGRLSGLVKSEYGYHIFLVEERRDPIHLSLQAAHDEIRDKLRAEQEEQAYQKWLQELRSKASIEIDWSLL